MAIEDTGVQTPYTQDIDLATAYEGAAHDYQTGLRDLFNGEADTLAVRELRYLQSRSTALCRNNGYADIAAKNWVTNAGTVHVAWEDAKGKPHKIMQAYWDEFSKNPSYDGYGDYNTLSSVAKFSVFITGNAYVRKLIIRAGNKNTIPFKLQGIPSILHAITYSNYLNTPNKVIRYGIEFDQSIPVKYFFKQSALQNAELAVPQIEPIGINAQDIIHTFIRKEPGQWLGIPILAPVILSMYALDDLITATITKQKAAQSIAIIVEEAGTAMSMLPVGSTKTKDTDGSTKVHYRNSSNESQVLYPSKGQTVKTFQGTDIGANLGTLIESELRKIATTCDALYHQLTGDTAGLNYSSLLGMAVQSRNRLEFLQNAYLIPLWDKPIAESFKALATVYNGKCASATPRFQLPRWRGYDDLKDAQADILELQNGLGTVKDKLTERGLTPADVLADAEERKVFEKHGIVWNTAGSNPSMQQQNNTSANSNSTGT